MNGLIHLFHLLIGTNKSANSESKFIAVTCLIAITSSFIFLLYHLILNLKPEVSIVSGLGIIFLAFVYYLARYTKYLILSKVLLSIIGLFFLDLVWSERFLSQGPVLYFVFAFGALLIWIWDKKWLLFMMTFYFINLAALYYFEINNQGINNQYPSLSARTNDTYISIVIYSLVFYGILWFVKKEFDYQKNKAIKSDKLKSAFLANMSHEIRTPMNAIIGFSDLLEKKDENNNNELYINIIKNSGENLLKLIEEIIDLSKIEAGYFQLRNSNINLTKLFEELKNTTTIELNKRSKNHIKLICNTPETDLLIFSDELRLLQILSNLLNNAIKFTEKGTISFSYKKVNNEVVFCVSDTGIGISAEDQKRIFGRFIKFNYNNLNIEGSGIGLSIVEKIVEVFNGKLWVKSKPGEGSEFYFSIPYNEPVIEEQNNNLIIDQADVSGNHKKVLIVEDDDNSALLLTHILESFEFDILYAKNGTEAIEFTKANPDVFMIFMDIKIPKPNGRKATKKIREFNSEVVIVAQTAGAYEEDETKALKAGCNEFITKPLETEIIHRIVNSYLKKSKPSAELIDQ